MEFDRVSLDRLPMHSLNQAVFFQLFGFGISQMRMPSVLMGLGVIVPVFLTLRSWLGGNVAALAAAVMAFGPLCLSESIWAPGISNISTTARHDIIVGFFAA